MEIEKEEADLPRDGDVCVCTCTGCGTSYRNVERAAFYSPTPCGPFKIEMIERVTRPFTEQYDSIEAFTEDYERHTEYQSMTKGYPEHADQAYPLVVDCPDCDHIATVCQLSPTDDPLWRCRSGEHSYLESKFRADDLGIDDVGGCSEES